MDQRDDLQSYVALPLSEERLGVASKAAPKHPTLFEKSPHVSAASLVLHDELEVVNLDLSFLSEGFPYRCLCGL